MLAGMTSHLQKYPDSLDLKEVPHRDRTHVVVGRRKRKAFLSALRRTGEVLRAAHAAGWADTSVVRKLRNDSEEFASEWDAALYAGTDVLVEEAYRRGMEGVFKPTYYKGKMVGGEYKHSDTLLQMLIRAHRSEFRDKTSKTVEHTGAVGVALLPMTAPSTEEWENRVAAYHKIPQLLEVPGEENVFAPVEPASQNDGRVNLERS
jgi:hypothetical protein